MKTKLLLVLSLIPALLFGAAGDIKIDRKNSSDNAWIATIFAKQNNALIGTSAAGVPQLITASGGVTISAGSILLDTSATVQFAKLGLGVANTNGALMFANGTTAAAGIYFGTDTTLYKTAQGNLTFSGNGSASTALTIDNLTGSSNASIFLTGRNGGTGAIASIFADQTGGLSLSSATGRVLNLQTGGGTVFSLSSAGAITATPTARASGVASYFTMNTPADTIQTASTESIGEWWKTATRQWANSGTVVVQREHLWEGLTYTANSGTQTFTDVFTGAFTAPIQGSNAAITRGHSLGVIDSTSATSSITGGFIVAATAGTAATSVGIGGGNINAGGSITFGKTVVSTPTSLTYASPTSVDVTLASCYTVTTVNATGSVTFNATAGGTAGQEMTIIITNDATSAKTITFGTNFNTTGTLTASAVSRRTTITFKSDGTTFHETGRAVLTN